VTPQKQPSPRARFVRGALWLAVIAIAAWAITELSR